MDIFEIAQGTVPGTTHTRAGKNNQDAISIRRDAERLVAVVCDGCSSSTEGSSHNEVGARLGAEIVATELWNQVAEATCDPSWPTVRYRVVEALEAAVASAGGRAGSGRSRTELVCDMFLFTIVAACITPERASFAAIGDGTVFINGQPIKLGPFAGGAPPYLGYALIESAIPPEQLHFNVLASMPTEQLQSFLVGSDGVQDLIEARDRILPNDQPVDVIDRLWEKDRFFKNPDTLRRHLVLANGGIDRRLPGYLSDDTTLAVGRRSRG